MGEWLVLSWSWQSVRQPVGIVDYPYIDKCTRFTDGLQGAIVLATLGQPECPSNGGFVDCPGGSKGPGAQPWQEDPRLDGRRSESRDQ